MNIIELIERNHFLKQLFPNGLHDFFVGNIELSCFDRIGFVLHTKQKPNREIDKWGTWGKDYNIITIEIIGSFIKKVNVTNWQNNKEEICDCIVSKKQEGISSIIFQGKNWTLEVELSSLVFQRNSVYVHE